MQAFKNQFGGILLDDKVVESETSSRTRDQTIVERDKGSEEHMQNT